MSQSSLTPNNLARIAQLARAGLTIGAIHKKLRAEGVPTSRSAVGRAVVAAVSHKPGRAGRKRGKAASAAPGRPGSRPATSAPRSGPNPAPHVTEATSTATLAAVDAFLDDEVGDFIRLATDARESGTVAGRLKISKAIVDLAARIEARQPPPPPAETDADLRQAGERAFRKLHDLVAAAKAERQPVVDAAVGAIRELARRAGTGPDVAGLLAVALAPLADRGSP